MIDSNQEDFYQMIAGMLNAYGQEDTPPRMAFYWEGLADLPFHDVKNAVASVAREHEGSFPPAPAQIRKLAKPDVEMIAMKAWMITQKAALAPQARPLMFQDPRIHVVIRYMGNRFEFFEQAAHAGHHVRKEFLATYKALFDQPLTDESARPLGGNGVMTIIDGELAEAPVAKIKCPYTIEHDMPRIETNCDNLPRITEKVSI